MKKSLLTILAVLGLDQASKIWVKTNMQIGDQITMVGDWAHLYFLENRGMAYGMEFGGDWGKMGLSIFRLVAVVVIIFYLRRLIKEKAPSGLIICASLVLAGAFGNIIDSAVYGLVFSESYTQVADWVAFGTGYSSFLMGDVVDMLYFPLFTWQWPDWLPLVGGDSFTFFRPVFNIADASITTGLLTIFAFQKRYFKGLDNTPADSSAPLEETAVEEGSEGKVTEETQDEIVDSILGREGES